MINREQFLKDIYKLKNDLYKENNLSKVLDILINYYNNMSENVIVHDYSISSSEHSVSITNNNKDYKFLSLNNEYMELRCLGEESFILFDENNMEKVENELFVFFENIPDGADL
jgi:hypothetical protein